MSAKTNEAVPRKGARPRLETSAPGLNSVLERNIHALMERRRDEAAAASGQERIAIAITRFTGSLLFVYVHLVIFGFWIISNVWQLPGIPRFDPSFVLLATTASVEAIFLSTFVLISQNRMAALADRRADLDVQINLLTEHELTRLLSLMSSVAQQLGVKTDIDQEVEELKQDVAPEAVLDKLESTQELAHPR